MPDPNPALINYVDSHRTETQGDIPRRPYAGGKSVDPALGLHDPTPKPPAAADVTRVPRNFSFLRAATPGAARVGLPDKVRTAGKLQQSGEAWGSFNDSPRTTAALPIQKADI